MAIQVDVEQRVIQGAIRDLVSHSVDSRRGMGLFRRVRADLGNQVHQDYRKRKAGVAGFKAEVQVSLELEISGFRVLLTGRADGIMSMPGGVLVEEVKSVAMGGADLAHVDASFFPDYSMQVRLYALALHLAGHERVSAKLVLCSLIDGSWHELPVDFDPVLAFQEVDEIVTLLVEQDVWRRTRAERLKELSRRLSFPYKDYRPGQEGLVDTFLQALSEGGTAMACAPTGIGKTVSAVTAGLKAALAEAAPMLFLTAKNTQQELVAKTFEDICKANGDDFEKELKCLLLRSKERMCIPGDLACHPDLCTYMKDFQERLVKTDAVARVMEAGAVVRPEHVVGVGESYRLCPFMLSLAAAREVNLVVCDYNYAYDPGIALSQFFDEQGVPPVVVIDEAHNLFDRARNYFSPVITKKELYLLKAHLAETRPKKREGVQAEFSDNEKGFMNVDAEDLFSRLEGLRSKVEGLLAGTLAGSEQSMLPSMDGCRKLEQDPAAWKEASREATRLVLPYSLYNRLKKRACHNDPVLVFLSKIVSLHDLLDTGEDEFVYFVADKRWREGPAIGVVCVNPANMLARMHKRAFATAAMSATLRPLQYYADVLGLSPFHPVMAELESPFPRENLLVRADTSISIAYRHRHRSYEPVARLIETVLSAKPGKYAVFFPSFEFLSKVDSRLRVNRSKVLVQSRNMGQEQRDRLLERFRSARGPMVLLAVMGGSFGEGIDLPGAELIGAVVVGIGLPQVSFEREMMKAYFQEKYEQGFAYAMLYPGMQRVVQSAGRVIRTGEDKGVVILVDQRFGNRDVLACLPEHWYSYSSEELFYGDLESALEKFWSQWDPAH